MKIAFAIALLAGIATAQQTPPPQKQPLPPVVAAAIRKTELATADLAKLASVGCAYQLTSAQLEEMGTRGGAKYCAQKVLALELRQIHAIQELINLQYARDLKARPCGANK